MVQCAARPCFEEDHTKEHIPQRCKKYDKERSAARLIETTLNQKLHGNDKNLKGTTFHPCDWPDRVTANEKKKMKKLCTLHISNAQV